MILKDLFPCMDYHSVSIYADKKQDRIFKGGKWSRLKRLDSF